MIGNNYTKVKKRLDELRKKGPKFMCLNDDMNKTHDPDPRVLDTLNDFFTGCYPKRCPFELPEGETNGVQYIQDYTGRLGKTDFVMILLVVLAVVGVALMLLPEHLRVRLMVMAVQVKTAVWISCCNKGADACTKGCVTV